jgi:hypothetical protein
MGFRCWLAGYQTCDIECWEMAWQEYATALGPVQAKAAMSELSCWVRAIRDTSHRRIEIYPPGCVGFCQDECTAIAMIAACQQSACPAARACAFALLGTSQVDEAVASATSFATMLAAIGQRLSLEAVSGPTAMSPART